MNGKEAIEVVAAVGRLLTIGFLVGMCIGLYLVIAVMVGYAIGTFIGWCIMGWW